MPNKINAHEAINKLGNAYYRENNTALARECYEKAIALNPDYAEAHFNLGLVLTRLAEDTHAIEHLLKAIIIKPTFIPALNQLGDLYLRHEKYTDAKALFLRSLALLPDHLNTHYQLGIIAVKEKNFTDAVLYFEKVLMQDHRYLEINQYLANTWLELGDHQKATHYYFRQLEENPLFETHYNLGVLFMMKERLNDALHYFNQAIQLAPTDLSTHINCGTIYLKKNDLVKAAYFYHQANSLKPNDLEIQHILSALQQNKVPDKAPESYITHLFDQYAPYYETHLTKYLDYDVPKKMLAAIRIDCALLPEKGWKIIDLGCGTGLCGELFHPFSKQLIGIDLSDNMLTVARAKKIYDELVCDDVAHALNYQSLINLIIAADVFTYLGDLETIFKNAQKGLVLGGFFTFTVEKTFDHDFVLQTSIRYAHSKTYIESLAKQYGFEIARFDNIQLRKQKNEPIEGYLVVLLRACLKSRDSLQMTLICENT